MGINSPMIGSKIEREVDYIDYHALAPENRDFEASGQWELVNGTLKVDGKELIAMARGVLPKWYR